MRIAIFSDNFYPELSGISDSIVMTGKELGRRGHHVRFYAPTYVKKNFERLGLPYREIELGQNVSVVRLSSFPYATGTGQGRLVIPTGRCVSDAKKFRPDVLHAHLPFGVGLEGVIAASKLKKPLVGTNHTPVTEFIRYSPIKFQWAANLFQKYDTWFYNHCDFVSSPARAIIDEMRRLGFKKPAERLSNPIDLGVYRLLSEKKELKARFGLSPHTILYVGRLAPEKKIDTIMRAVARAKAEIPDITFAIVGAGSAERELKKTAAALKIEDAVKFLGFLDSHDLPKAYNASDVFTIMSTAETQSIAMMNAMACGLPAIGAKAWGLKEYISGENGILVEPGDEHGLSEAMVELFKNQALRKKLSSGAIAFAGRIGIPAIADLWEEIYERVIRRYNKDPRPQISP